MSKKKLYFNKKKYVCQARKFCCTSNLNSIVPSFIKIYLKYFLFHFPYILTVTLPSLLVSDGKVVFELEIPRAKLLSPIRPFIWYTYRGTPALSSTLPSVILVKTLLTTDFGFVFKGANYFRDDREK